eukprot:357719-Rhodomonas_salina.2
MCIRDRSNCIADNAIASDSVTLSQAEFGGNKEMRSKVEQMLVSPAVCFRMWYTMCGADTVCGATSGKHSSTSATLSRKWTARESSRYLSPSARTILSQVLTWRAVF